ncbi:MAG: histidine kinase, partial [Variovorax sp.]|nr:histidine kinase [Variovorax sp.]
LLGRLEHMRALLDDSRGIEALRSRPQLYENMLGNRDNLLWVLDDAGRMLIEINPPGLPLPQLPRDGRTHLRDIAGEAPARLAWTGQRSDGHGLTLIAGKLLTEREQMLAAYRLKLWLALLVGGVLLFLLGWAVSQRGLRPVRQLATRAQAVDVRHLHLRLDSPGMLDELQALSQALDRMLARLEEGFAQLSRFSADLAHELRTPLANLMGQTQLALRSPRCAARAAPGSTRTCSPPTRRSTSVWRA